MEHTGENLSGTSSTYIYLVDASDDPSTNTQVNDSHYSGQEQGQEDIPRTFTGGNGPFYPFKYLCLTQPFVTSEDIAWLFSLFDPESNQSTATPSTTLPPAGNTTSIDRYNNTHPTNTHPRPVQRFESPTFDDDVDPYDSTSNVASNEDHSLPGNTAIEAEPPPIPSRRPRRFKCRYCGRMFDRLSRARSCERNHNTHPCLGQCGVPDWLAH